MKKKKAVKVILDSTKFSTCSDDSAFRQWLTYVTAVLVAKFTGQFYDPAAAAAAVDILNFFCQAYTY